MDEAPAIPDGTPVECDWRKTDWPKGWMVHEKRDGWVSVYIPPETYPGGMWQPRTPRNRGYHKRGVRA